MLKLAEELRKVRILRMARIVVCEQVSLRKKASAFQAQPLLPDGAQQPQA